MAAYSKVNGHSMTESPLLEDVLKRRLGYDGVVLSDWSATRSTEDSARAALDLDRVGAVPVKRAEVIVDAVRRRSRLSERR